jgi:threonine/homoserine/homoserine lactone efflux protein
MSHRTNGRNLAVLLLLDLSESLGDKVRVGNGEQTVLELSQEAVSLLAWAIEQLGDPLAIAGFHSDTRHDVRYLHLKGFSEGWGDPVKRRLAAMQAGYSTRMGAAMRHAAHYLAAQPAEKKLMLILTDGQPSDVDVQDERLLIEDARKSVGELEQQGIFTYCISLDRKADEYVQRYLRRAVCGDRQHRAAAGEAARAVHGADAVDCFLRHSKEKCVHLNTWLLFVVTVFFVSATPGPNMLLAMSHGIRFGVRGALPTMAGLLCALGLIMAASVAGLGALLAASETVFTLVKYAGAGYLVWLGYQAWCAPVGETACTPVAVVEAPISGGQRFRTGFLVAMSNPKAFVFFAALFPQFTRADMPQLPQWLALAITFYVIESSWQLAYVYGGASLRLWLTNPRRQRLINRLAGGSFMAAGIALSTVSNR